MNKFSLYSLLILIFLGLSKSFAPAEQKTNYISDEKVFASFYKGAPLSVILLDSFQAGFLIKTHYLKLKIVHGFKRPREEVVRTGQAFWQRVKKYRGMSLFRRYERDQLESTLPLPPGSLYVGDPAFGNWKMRESSDSNRYWYFYKAYRHFPTLFLWGDFVPNHTFYNALKIQIKNNRPFFGIDREFGENGRVTQAILRQIHEKTQNEKRKRVVNYLSKYFSIPPWSQ
jgi:hypothetical protein